MFFESNASKEKITQAFHAKALVYHPDKGGNADEFKILHQAYQKLMHTDSVPGIIKDSGKTKIKMICKKGHEWSARADDIVYEQKWCSLCSKNQSQLTFSDLLTVM